MRQTQMAYRQFTGNSLILPEELASFILGNYILSNQTDRVLSRCCDMKACDLVSQPPLLKFFSGNRLSSNPFNFLLTNHIDYQVLIEKGFEGASIGKMAKRMNIHPPPIIRCFKTKENMTFELVDPFKFSALGNEANMRVEILIDR